MVNGRWIVGIASGFVLVAGAGSVRAQTQANITPHVVPVVSNGLDDEGNPAAGLLVVQNYMPAPDEIKAGCAPGPGGITVLKFSLNTYNDGYENFALSVNDPNLKQGPDDTHVFFQLDVDGSYWLRDFARILLVDTATHRVVASNRKERWFLASDDPVPYRTDFPVKKQDPSFADFITWAYVDEYDQSSYCQFVRIDGVPDGTYDLVVEEDYDRNTACGPASDADCIYDGRISDNATALRIHLANQNLDSQDDQLPAPVGANDTSHVQPVGPPVIASAPAVVSHNLNSYDIFFVGTDGNLYTATEDGSTGAWSAEQSILQVGTLGRTPTGAVAAAATDRVSAQLFLATVEGDVLQGEWAAAGGYVRVFGSGATGYGSTGRPVAVASGPQSAMAVWMAPGGYPVYTVFDGSVWQQPAMVPTQAGLAAFPANQVPALASSGDGMYHLFVRDATGAVWYQQYFLGTWPTASWTSLGMPAEGPITTDLSAASPYLNRVDVFGATAAHDLQRNGGSGSCAGSTCTFSFFDGWVNDLATPDTQGGPYCKYLSGNCTAVATHLGSAAPVAISTGPEKLDVFYYDRIHQDLLWHLHYDGTLLRVNGVPQTQWSLESIGQSLVTTPMWPLVAASWADNTFDVFQNYLNGQIGVRSRR